MNGFRVVRVSNTGSVGWCFCQRVLPPFDSISPFFYSGPNDFNKQTVDPTFAWVAQLTPSSNATREEVAENGYTQIAWLGTMPGIQGSQNPIFTYDSPSSVDPSRTYTGTLSTWYGINADGEIDHGIGGFPFGNNIGIMGYSTWARYEGLPAADKNFYKDRHLTDTSIFNFYDYLIDGPNKKEWQNWQTYNLNLIQTFFSDRLGVEFVYDVQEYDDGQSRSLGDPVLSVDIRSNYLNYPWSYAEAVPNPDAGRAFVATGGRSGGNNSNITRRANVRGTVFGELRADDLLDKSLLTDIIGRHTFTGLYSKETYDSENRNWVKWAVDQRYPEDVGTGVSGSGTGGELNSGRTVDVITYLSGDLRGRNTAAGLNLRPLTVIQSPLGSANISYFDSHWNAPEVDPAAIWYDPSNIDPESDGESTESENPLNYVGWVNGNYDILNGDYGDRANLLTDVNRIRKITESAGFTWQGYWFQDLLVSTFGWRRDEQKLLSGASSLSDSATGHATINPAFDPYDPEGNFSSGESISWGVVAHSPEFIKKRLPWNSNISLSYSSGKNSRVENRYGFDGNELPNAAGKTTDIGVALSLLDNRLQIKATWYETEVEDANIASVSTGSSTLGGDTYYVYLLESWGTASALTNLAGAAGDAPGYEWYWNWAAINADWDEAYNDPKGELFMNDPLTAQMLEASHSWLSQLQPQSWFDAYGMDVNVALAAAGDYKNALLRGNWAAGNIGGIQAAGAGRIRGVYPTGTVDNKSEGVEIEITGQPIDGLSLSLNVSKTNAFQTALGESLVTFIEGAYQKYQTPAGDLRLWWGGDRTVREYFESVWAAYQFQLETNGKLVAEMSPWRANMVANYTFKNGRLNGLNLGGGVRWQDKAAVGYPLNEEQDNLNVDKPYWSDARHWVDLWAGYERQLTDKIKWRLQLNLRNVGKDISLVPISVQPDGTPAQYRIEEGMTWSITNTFSF